MHSLPYCSEEKAQEERRNLAACMHASLRDSAALPSCRGLTPSIIIINVGETSDTMQQVRSFRNDVIFVRNSTCARAWRPPLCHHIMDRSMPGPAQSQTDRKRERQSHDDGIIKQEEGKWSTRHSLDFEIPVNTQLERSLGRRTPEAAHLALVCQEKYAL